MWKLKTRKNLPLSIQVEITIMYLEGSRPLLASEVLDVQKGLFDDDL
jgi:hypothetical protein